MDQIDKDLNAWLTDINRQNWVEIKIIQRLHKLDTKKIFYQSFHEALVNCNNVRTIHSSDGKQFYEFITNHRHTILVQDFKDSLNEVQSCLGSIIGKLISSDLIRNLYTPNQERIFTVN